MLIITGCQRSGTMTLAHILGIRHEQQFNSNTTHEEVSAIIGKRRLMPESSWLAMPFFKLFKKDPDIRVIHLVRHPLNVVASLVGIGFWDVEGHGPYRDFIYKYLPGLLHLSSPITKSVYYWLYWNQELEEFPRIQIESIQGAPVTNCRNRAELSWEQLAEQLPDNLYNKLQDKMGLYKYGTN